MIMLIMINTNTIYITNNVITTNYGDYQSVENVMFPFFMELPAQKLEFKTTSVIFNKELKDSSF